GGLYESPFRSLGMHSTASTPYWELSRIFRHPAARVGHEDVLVDVGCGRGRVIAWWLRMGLGTRLVGVELTPEVAAATRAAFAAHANVTILAGDVRTTSIPEATLYYLSNPFDRAIVSAFKDLVKAVHAARSGVRIVYYKAQYVDVFTTDADFACVKLPS